MYIGGSSRIHGQEGRLCGIVHAWASKTTMPDVSEPITRTDHVYTPSAADLFLLLLVLFCFGTRSLVAQADLQLLVERIVKGVLGLLIHFPSTEIAGT